MMEVDDFWRAARIATTAIRCMLNDSLINRMSYASALTNNNPMFL